MTTLKDRAIDLFKELPKNKDGSYRKSNNSLAAYSKYTTTKDANSAVSDGYGFKTFSGSIIEIVEGEYLCFYLTNNIWFRGGEVFTSTKGNEYLIERIEDKDTEDGFYISSYTKEESINTNESKEESKTATNESLTDDHYNLTVKKWTTDKLPSDTQLKTHAKNNLAKYKKQFLTQCEKVKKLVGEKSYNDFLNLSDNADEDRAEFLSYYYLEFNPSNISESNLIRYILIEVMNNSKRELRGLKPLVFINGIGYEI